MPIEKIAGGGIVVTGNSISLFRMLSLRGSLRLEVRGMKRSRGPSAYSIIKDEFGLKGTKEKVLEQFNKLVEEAGRAHQQGSATPAPDTGEEADVVAR